MKKYTGKKGGMIYKGIYTTSCMPNQKPKRVKKSKYEEVGKIISHEILKVRMNFVGIASAIFIGLYTPFDANWKIIIAVLLVISSIHVEVENE